MNELQVFNYQSNEIRTVMKDGEPWWVLKDVCDALGITNYRNVAARLDDDEKGVRQMDTLGGKQELIVISESGLYNVILRSDKPEAKEFKRWVTHEVLPSIRKHGAYMTPSTLMEVATRPESVIGLLEKLKDEMLKNRELQKINNELAPKAEVWQSVCDTNGLTNFRDTAKLLHVGERFLVNKLIEKKLVYRDRLGKLRPYKNCMDFFEVKKVENNGWFGVQTFVTPDGVKAIRSLLSDSPLYEVAQ